MNLKTRRPIRLKSHYLAIFVLVVVSLAAATLLERRNGKWDDLQGGIDQERKPGHDDGNHGIGINGQDSRRCNMFSGRWVFDNLSNPLYEEGLCSFMRNEFSCHKHGRRDSEYRKWRWQPDGCDLPSFDGAALLEKLRGKKIIFVGDSVNRNQWTSLVCLLEPSLNQSTPKSAEWKNNLYFFHADEYNATIGFYWSPLLVESNGDDPLDHRIRDRVARITSIENHARHWTDADILVFNSYAWWLEPNMTLLWGSFDGPNAIKKTVGMKLRRYEMALNTWSEWLETNVDRDRTHMFFMSLSPMHFADASLGETRSCYNVSGPDLKPVYRAMPRDPEMMNNAAREAVESLKRRGVAMEFLNITTLSEQRRDGHPSIYRNLSSHGGEIEKKMQEDPDGYSDCLHWCVPGVPDVWNQILYSYILNLP